MIQILFVATLALFCAVQCQDPVTTPGHHHSHAPHTTRESNERDGYSFHYDGHLQDLIVKSGHDCYIMPLSDLQRKQVHDPSEIYKVEIAALKLIADKSVQKTVDPATLAHHLAHDCKGSNNVIQLSNN